MANEQQAMRFGAFLKVSRGRFLVLLAAVSNGTFCAFYNSELTMKCK
jgi:hypothetical protein